MTVSIGFIFQQVVTAAKEMGKELYANLDPEERRIKLDAMVMKPNNMTSLCVSSSDMTSECVMSFDITKDMTPKSTWQDQQYQRYRSLSEPVSGSIYISTLDALSPARISEIEFINCNTGDLNSNVTLYGSNEGNSGVSSECNLDSVMVQNQELRRNSLSNSWSDLGVDVVSDSLTESIIPQHWFDASLNESGGMNRNMEQSVGTARCRSAIQADVFTPEYLNLSFN